MRWALRGTVWAVLLAGLAGCADPAASSEPEETDEPTAMATEQTDPPEVDPPTESQTAARPPLSVAPVDISRPNHLDERTGARVRSAIRRRIGARPTLLTARHYRTEEGGSITFASFTAPYLERCVAGGTPREECLLSGGDGALTRNQQECVFGGIARIDLGPDDGDRPGPMRIVGVHRIGDGEACAFEVDFLRLVDEDGDGDPEVLMRYTWSDLRHAAGEHVVTEVETIRESRRADLEVQVQLTLRAFHPGTDDPEERNVVSQLRHIESEGHVDLAHDVIDWLAAECPEEDPPRGHEECDIREATTRYRYASTSDRWQALDEPPL